MNIYKQDYKVRDKATGQMITKQSDNWYFRFNRFGKTHTGSTGTGNLTKAQHFVARKLREIEDEREVKIARGGKEQITIEKAFQTYLDSQARSGQLKNIDTRLNKMLGHKLSPAKEPVVVFGFDRNRMLDSLSTADAQHLVLNRRKEGSSDGTILAELTALNQVIKLMKKLNYVIPDIDFADIKKDSQVRPFKGKLRKFSPDEQNALLVQLHPDTVVRGSGSPLVYEQRQDAYDLAVLLFDVGGRYDELAKLRWDQVDLARKLIHLYRPKVRNESVIMMTTRVAEVLKRRRKSASEDADFVFEAKDGTARKYSPRAFRSAIKRAGLEGATIHTIRHTYGSDLVDAGESLYSVQMLMGHSSPATTQRYAHLSITAAATRAADVLNQRNQGAQP